MSLEHQIAKVLATLPTKPRTYIVRPPKPKSAGGKKRHGNNPEWKWERNISTGNAYHKVSKNTRIVRIGDTGPYYCEYWGDYSLNYPVRGSVKSTASEALKTCSSLKKINVSGGKKRHGFSALEKTLSKRKDVKDAGALAARIGTKKLGKRKMKKLAAEGRKRAARKASKRGKR